MFNPKKADDEPRLAQKQRLRQRKRLLMILAGTVFAAGLAALSLQVVHPGATQAEASPSADPGALPVTFHITETVLDTAALRHVAAKAAVQWPGQE
jgi:hypothetical protein